MTDKTFYRVIPSVFFLVFCFIASHVYADDVMITVDPARIHTSVNETVSLTAVVQWPAENNNHLSIQKITPPESSLMTLVDAHQTSGVKTYGAHTVAEKKFRYTYKAVEKGAGVFSPFILELQDADGNVVLQKSGEIPVAVVSVLQRMAFFFAVGVGVFVCVIGIVFVDRFMRKCAQGKRETALRAERDQKMRVLEVNALARMKDIHKHMIAGEHVIYFRRIRNVLQEYKDTKCGLAKDETVCGDAFESIMHDLEAYIEKIAYAGCATDSDSKLLVRKIEHYFKSRMTEEDDYVIEQ